MEVCEQKEEIIKTRIIEEQKKKTLMAIQELLKMSELETDLQIEKQLGSNYKKSNELEDDDFKSQDSQENQLQMIQLASIIQKQNEKKMQEIKPKIEHDKGDILERMDILAGQRRLIIREIKKTI